MSVNLKTMNVEQLSEILQKTPRTILADIYRRPESLPPRLNIPRSTKPLWLETDVIEWLNQVRVTAP